MLMHKLHTTWHERLSVIMHIWSPHFSVFSTKNASFLHSSSA